MEIIPFVAEALGDASFLVVSGQSAAVIDPQRDIRPFEAEAERRGATIVWAVETHVHNDYLSGGTALAARGARVVVPEGSELKFPHMAIPAGERLEFGGVLLQALATPGHTYEHTAYLARSREGGVEAAFTGGSLLMAAAGRSDLLGPAHAADLARLQWESAQLLREVTPGQAYLYPTHGAGSFCSSSGTDAGRWGPMALELTRNPALIQGLDAFGHEHLADLAPIPAYYRQMAPLNRSGPRVYEDVPRPARLDAGQVSAFLGEAVDIVDVRARSAFARGHVKGSLSVEASDSMLAYLSWLLAFNAPLALIVEDEAQAREVTVDLFRIGFEQVVGYLRWTDWQRAGRPVESLPSVSRHEARRLYADREIPVVDVRFAHEQRSQPVPGAVERPIDEIGAWANAPFPDHALVVCASGQRAVTAASYLRRAGHDVEVLVDGGASDLA
jgi:hydroxyacylglutathione hydrolase